MWLNALDILLKRASKKCDLSKIVAISGSGQQHGSVYWSENGLKVLQNLNNVKLLHELFDENCFTRKNSPIWMDNSTTKQCKQLEELIGIEKLTLITGSSAYQRFTLYIYKKKIIYFKKLFIQYFSCFFFCFLDLK